MTLIIWALAGWVALSVVFLAGWVAAALSHRCRVGDIHAVDDAYRRGLADGLAARADEIAELERIAR